MNRKEIKELAKSKIKGNLWDLLWPILLIGAIEGVLTSIFAPTTYNVSDLGQIQITTSNQPAAIIIGLIAGIAMVAYKKYLINFVRNGKVESNDMINCIKEKWLQIVITELLMGIIIGIASILLVIPGIIAALGLSMATYLVVDTELSGVDSLKKSWEIMKGYKLDYFVFDLSFIGWALLTPFTLGLLLIWLAPYMSVADTIYYDKLKEKHNIK
ncbi:MAG: DUF975 family protein [Bacilli bacterium]|nr:DUF975 family protein [Bacilli bacterium]